MRRRQVLTGIVWGNAAPLAMAETLAWENIQKRGLLSVACDPTFGLPYFALDEARHSYQGFEWDILQALSRVLKVQIRVTEVLWPQQRSVLLQGGVDAIFNAQEAPDLKKFPVLVTEPYYITSQSLISPPQRVIETLTDLVGQRVGVLRNSGGAALVSAYNLYKARSVKLITATTAPELFYKLEKSEVDVLILDSPLAQWLNRKGQFQIAQVYPLPIPLVGVVRKSEPSLQKALNRGLKQIVQIGTLETILKKWQLWNTPQTQLTRHFSSKS